MNTQQVYREFHQRIALMTPDERQDFAQQLAAKMRALPPSFQKMAAETEKRLKDADPREPPGLGHWTSAVANLAQAATAVAGAYLAFEGFKAAREERDRERSQAERDAAMAAAQRAAMDASFAIPGAPTPPRPSYLPWALAGVAGLGLIGAALMLRKRRQ